MPDWSRTAGQGRYARPERERRFLVVGPPPPGSDVRRIEDRYLRGTRLRLRTVGADGVVVYKLTQKVRPGADDPRDVSLTNTYLSEQEYAALAVLPADVLVKTRRTVAVDGTSWVVDAFDGRWRGLVLAEVEVADLGAPVALPGGLAARSARRTPTPVAAWPRHRTMPSTRCWLRRMLAGRTRRRGR